MLTLSKDTWHYKNFRAWQLHTNSKRHHALRPSYGWDEDWSTRIELEPIRQPDLCTYTRIALVYGPWHRLKNWATATEARATIAFISTLYLAFVVILAIGRHLVEEENKLELWMVFAFPALFMIAGAIMLAVVIAVFIASDFMKEKYKEYKWQQEGSQEKPKSEPNVVVEFIKAKKRKICPFIEFAE